MMMENMETPPITRDFTESGELDLAQSYSKIGEVSAVEKKFAAAIEYLSWAETILSELTITEPRHDGYRYSLANNYARLGAAREGVKDLTAAIESYQKAIEKHTELRKRDEKDNMSIRAIAVAAQDAGRIYNELGETNQALVFYRRSLEMFALLEQKGSLGEYDRNGFETSRKAVEKLTRQIGAK